MMFIVINVILFAEKQIGYYGDPLKDFSLAHFLERFSFKNPKKYDTPKAETSTVAHKRYISHGSRGKPVQSLTKCKCTEDEMFIFNYLENKRETHSARGEQDKKRESMKATDVDDDEFDEYLNNFFSKKTKEELGDGDGDGDDEEDLDFLKELGADFTKDKQNKKKNKNTDNDDRGSDDEWGNEDEQMSASDASEREDEEISELDDEDDENDNEEELDSLNENDVSESDESQSDNDDDDESLQNSPQKAKKRKLNEVNNKNFAKTLKHSGGTYTLCDFYNFIVNFIFILIKFFAIFILYLKKSKV